MKDKQFAIGTYYNKIYYRLEKRWQRMVLWILNKTRLVETRMAFLEKYGSVKEDWAVSNSVMSGGKAQMALLIGDASATPFTYLEVGTSATAVNVSQTALQAAITDTGLARAAATVSRITTSVTNDTFKLAYTWTASGAKTIEEVGVFNANSAGTMLSRALTGSKVMANGETLATIYTLQFT